MSDMNPNQIEDIEVNNPASYEVIEEKNYVPDIVNIAIANMSARIFKSQRLRNAIRQKAMEYTTTSVK
uniref:Uncharacterized protein n=1 Tax=viral metagenome TaxID=1070528 RepID=A0A6C0CH48_9ZZZZ